MYSLCSLSSRTIKSVPSDFGVQSVPRGCRNTVGTVRLLLCLIWVGFRQSCRVLTHRAVFWTVDVAIVCWRFVSLRMSCLQAGCEYCSCLLSLCLVDLQVASGPSWFPSHGLGFSSGSLFCRSGLCFVLASDLRGLFTGAHVPCELAHLALKNLRCPTYHFSS